MCTMPMKHLDLKTIGDYPITKVKKESPASCFYFIEGNVLFLFDWSEENDTYFNDHKEEFKALRGIVLCFSSPNDRDKHIGWFLMQVVNNYMDLHDGLWIKLITTNTKTMHPLIIKYTWYKNRYIEEDLSNYKDEGIVKTNDRVLYVKASSLFTRSGYCAYTIWEKAPQGWGCLLYYTGMSGDLNDITFNFLLENPGTKLVYWIEKYRYRAGVSLSIDELCERLSNTFDELKNHIILLGCKSLPEAKYIKERICR